MAMVLARLWGNPTNYKILLAGAGGIMDFRPLTRRSLVKPVLPQHSRRLNMSVNLNQRFRKEPRR
jgi:hypothetical protein